MKVVGARVQLALGGAAEWREVHLVTRAVRSGVTRCLAHGRRNHLIRVLVGPSAVTRSTAAPRRIDNLNKCKR